MVAAVEVATEAFHSAAFDAFATGAVFCKAAATLGQKIGLEANQLFFYGFDEPILLVKPRLLKSATV